jgi:hypothetical protein
VLSLGLICLSSVVRTDKKVFLKSEFCPLAKSCGGAYRVVSWKNIGWLRLAISNGSRWLGAHPHFLPEDKKIILGIFVAFFERQNLGISYRWCYSYFSCAPKCIQIITHADIGVSWEWGRGSNASRTPFSLSIYFFSFGCWVEDRQIKKFDWEGGKGVYVY